MATIPQGERNAAIDGLMRVAGEDTQTGGLLLNYLNQSFPGFTWSTILRNRAANWAPFLASGLSISWWVDECIRIAAVYAQQ